MRGPRGISGYLVLGIAFALHPAGEGNADPDCSNSLPGSAYCADGTCQNIEVGRNGVQCVDHALEPLFPAGPDVEFQLGIGGG